MNRTTKDDEAEKPIPRVGPPDGKRFYYDGHDQLPAPFGDFMAG